jgi:hypothetical protein
VGGILFGVVAAGAAGAGGGCCAAAMRLRRLRHGVPFGVPAFHDRHLQRLVSSPIPRRRRNWRRS